MLFSAITPLVIRALHEIALFHAISTARTIVVVLLGAIALVLGIIAARRGNQPVQAGIAIGIGGIEVLATAVALGSNLLSSMLR